MIWLAVIIASLYMFHRNGNARIFSESNWAVGLKIILSNYPAYGWTTKSDCYRISPPYASSECTSIYTYITKELINTGIS